MKNFFRQKAVKLRLLFISFAINSKNMKPYTFICFLCLLSPLSIGQVVTSTYILESKIEAISKKKIDNNDSIIFVSTGYNNSTLEDSDLLKDLEGSNITRIDLVYTANKQNPSFAQTKLNTQRLNELYDRFPRIFDNNLIEWHLIEQNGYETQKEAEDYFHGFVFYLSNGGISNEKLTPEEEIAILDEWLKKAFPALLEDTAKTITEVPAIYSNARIHLNRYLPLLKNKREKGITFKRKLFFRKLCPEEIEASISDTIIISDKKGKKHVFVTYRPPITDTVVTAVMRRNIHLDTSTTLLIEDVTGSMYPYIYQTFEWRRKYHSKIRMYTFFNDGDHKLDAQKKIGSTGGIYKYEGNDITVLENKVKTAMRNGSGGDGPENNMEATLYGVENFASTDSIIMIVDNWAPVKDISLLPKIISIGKPIHLIICGFNGMIHSDYIRIAIETKGTIHTIEEDISLSKPIPDGTILTFGSQKFRYEKGKLLLTR